MLHSVLHYSRNKAPDCSAHCSRQNTDAWLIGFHYVQFMHGFAVNVLISMIMTSNKSPYRFKRTKKNKKQFICQQNFFHVMFVESSLQMTVSKVMRCDRLFRRALEFQNWTVTQHESQFLMSWEMYIFVILTKPLWKLSECWMRNLQSCRMLSF